MAFMLASDVLPMTPLADEIVSTVATLRLLFALPSRNIRDIRNIRRLTFECIVGRVGGQKTEVGRCLAGKRNFLASAVDLG
jgi:hypothetical protein